MMVRPPREAWYWPGASKTEIAQVMLDRPDGSFIVRDASTPGEYTLTVRCRKQTKLVRIHVSNGKCGFSPESLNYSSIEQLITVHRNISLKVYNGSLDVLLLYGMSEREVRRRHSGDNEWERHLALERYRVDQIAVDRAARLYDLTHVEMSRAENLQRAHANSIADLEKKRKLMEEVAEYQTGFLNEKKIPAFVGNNEMISETMSELAKELELVKNDNTKLLEVIGQLSNELVTAKSRLVSCTEKRRLSCVELSKLGISDQLVSEASSHAQLVFSNESMSVSRILIELPLKWDPSRFLVNDASKDAAATLIERARARLIANEGKRDFDGIFLIRPSASQAKKMVLSVLVGGKVSHCLIEESEWGYGFENGGLFFATLGDFVRYYSHSSLEEHNKAMKTSLTEPALP